VAEFTKSAFSENLAHAQLYTHHIGQVTEVKAKFV
jgi:hypothetical protein